MEIYTLEKIITVSVLCVWFLFPMGMLISFMIQDRTQKTPKISLAPTKKKHGSDYHKHFIINEQEHDHDADDDVHIPNIPAHQIPKKHNPNTHVRY